MAAAVDSRRGGAAPDELDRLLDNDNAVDDFLRDVPMRDVDPNAAANNSFAREERDEDQEVQVKKKRNPVPKLDENRLLSDGGIPKLRKIAKSRLKFRGKGHEFSDMSTLLNTYQLWLDDLYPRAKFRDALLMVEKVGHSKRMQVTRKAWLDDTKPFRREISPEREPAASNEGARDEDLFAEMVREGEVQRTSPEQPTADAPLQDELDDLLAQHEGSAQAPRAGVPPTRKGPFEMDEPDEDELDALLAEVDGPSPNATALPRDAGSRPSILPSASADKERSSAALSQPQPSQQIEDDFAAEEEAMAAMRDEW